MKNKEFQVNNKVAEKMSLLSSLLFAMAILGIAFAVSSIMGCSVPFKN